MMEVTPLQFGLVGMTLVGFWKMLDVAKAVFMQKRGLPLHDADEVPRMSALACQVDPTHFHRIKEIHDYTEQVQKDIAGGAFSCAWSGRDEVRDLLESMRALTKEVAHLADELKLARTAGAG